MTNNNNVSSPSILHKKGEKYINLSDGLNSYPIFIGGKFIHDNREFTIKGIDTKNNQINVNNRWYHKNEFEPAEVTLIKSKNKIKSSRSKSR